MNARVDPYCLPNGCESVGQRLGPNGSLVHVDDASVLNLIQALLRSPPIFQQPVPRLAPPYNAKPWSRYAIVVVAPNSATGDASATTGAAALATAESAARFETVAVVTPTGVGDYVPIFAEQLPELLGLRIARLGFRVHSSQRAIRFNVLRNGTPLNESGSSGQNGGANPGVFEISDYADLSDPMPYYGDIQPKEIVSVVAKNLDVLSGYLVEVLAQGWTYPTDLAGSSDRQATEITRQVAPGGRVV